MGRQMTPDQIKAVEAAAQATNNQVLPVPDGMTAIEFSTAVLLVKATMKQQLDVKTVLADEAKAIVTGARRSAYGTPKDNFDRIARFWNAYLVNIGVLPADVMGDPEAKNGITAADISPMMRLMKEARLCETPDHRDSFVDLIGYALTGAEINEVDPKKSA